MLLLPPLNKFIERAEPGSVVLSLSGCLTGAIALTNAMPARLIAILAATTYAALAEPTAIVPAPPIAVCKDAPNVGAYA